MVVDSFPLIVKRLEEMILITDITKTVYRADSYTGGLEIFESCKPDLVLLGISSPEENPSNF